MTEQLTSAESSVLIAIESSPGISATDLAKQLQRRTQEVLRVVESLVGKGRVQRQPTARTQTYVGPEGRIVSRTRNYNGLHAIPEAAEHEGGRQVATQQYWWKRVCIQDVRQRVILRREPSLEGKTTFDGPYPDIAEAARNRIPVAEKGVLYTSELVTEIPKALEPVAAS